VGQRVRAIGVLDAGDVLLHEITLPLAVERELGAAIELHLERELPLPKGQACVDWKVLHRDRTRQRLTVGLFIAHRRRVDSFTEAAEGAGLRLTRLAVKNAAGELRGNLLPRRTRVEAFRFTSRDRQLGAVAAGLAVVGAAAIGAQWSYERSRVDAKLQQVEAQARTAVALVRKLQATSAAPEALIRVMERPDAADVLNSLTSTVPQDAWAYELEVKPAPGDAYQIRFGGYAPAATMLVDVLEKGPRFGQVRLVAAASAGLGTGRDRLTLTAKYEAP
jgi:general secretion pathway protein L